MTVAQRIVEALRSAVLDDDQLAAQLGVVRQQINQTCRTLEKRGVLSRGVSRSGKIVNRLTGSSAPLLAAAHPPLPRPTVAGALAEDEVKTAIRDRFEAKGFTVEIAWGRVRGIDIEARRGAERWAIEAKGEAATDQMGGNYFLNALGELLQRMSDDRTRYAIALPENRRNLGLVARFPDLARRRLGLTVFFVRRDGRGYAVREVAPPDVL
jgi:hypothetical protein